MRRFFCTFLVISIDKYKICTTFVVPILVQNFKNLNTMKTMKVTIKAQSTKGLFVDESKITSISEVIKNNVNKNNSVILIDGINNTNRELLITGFIKRGATSANSPFTYISEDKKLLCADVRKFFGYDKVTKKNNEYTKVTFEDKLNKLLEKATKAQLEYCNERVAIYKAQIIEREKAEKAEKIKALEAELKKLKSE